MLWRVRAELPDHPGALAALAARCGDSAVNIVALQIFPGVGAVTDDLVLRSLPGWSVTRITDLIVDAGAARVEVTACTEDALADQPTRYVRAAQAIVVNPMSFPAVLARLFDAHAATSPDRDPGGTGGAGVPGGPVSAGHDVMELSVGDMVMQVRRDTPFTATEHARGGALADLVNEMLRPSAAVEHQGSSRRLGTGVAPEFVVDGPDVAAVVEEVVVALASVRAGDDDASRTVDLRVDPAWRRRGIGTRLLVDVSRLAHAMGAEEIVLRTDSANQAILPMVMAAGLRGRIRMSGDELTVRVPVGGLAPLRA